jgi:hypothetical protein
MKSNIGVKTIKKRKFNNNEDHEDNFMSADNELKHC